MRRFRKTAKIALMALALIITVYFIFLYRIWPPRVLQGSIIIGSQVDDHNGVAVYNNGPYYPQSHGKNYTQGNAYYFGKKWQCVEFIKRYYFTALGHRMPDGFGHAKDYFNKNVPHGTLNRSRNLLQFYNGKNEMPRPDDILVFDGSYGHVAIVTSVSDNELEVIQQNIFMKPRQKFRLEKKGKAYIVGENKRPLGWLRKK